MEELIFRKDFNYEIPQHVQGFIEYNDIITDHFKNWSFNETVHYYPGLLGNQTLKMMYADDMSDPSNAVEVFNANLVYVNGNIIVDFMDESAVLSCQMPDVNDPDIINWIDDEFFNDEHDEHDDHDNHEDPDEHDDHDNHDEHSNDLEEDWESAIEWEFDDSILDDKERDAQSGTTGGLDEQKLDDLQDFFDEFDDEREGGGRRRQLKTSNKIDEQILLSETQVEEMKQSHKKIYDSMMAEHAAK